MDCFVAVLLAMTKGGFPPILFHNATLVGRGLSSGTRSGTNRARIGDSPALRLRSPQHLAWIKQAGTRSSSAALDKQRFGGEFLKIFDAAESNQK